MMIAIGQVHADMPLSLLPCMALDALPPLQTIEPASTPPLESTPPLTAGEVTEAVSCPPTGTQFAVGPTILPCGPTAGPTAAPPALSDGQVCCLQV